jgi:hypothetical protein
MHDSPNFSHHTYDSLYIRRDRGFQTNLPFHAVVPLRVVRGRSDNAPESIILQLAKHLLRIASANLPCDSPLRLTGPSVLPNDQQGSYWLNRHSAVSACCFMYGGHSQLNQPSGVRSALNSADPIRLDRLPMSGSTLRMAKLIRASPHIRGLHSFSKMFNMPVL